MRRRVWYCVVQLDTISSLLLGLPSMIRAADYDTTDPRNIHDWELMKDMTDLPPSRPLSEETPLSYLLAKGCLLRVLGDVLDSLSSLRPLPYDTVLHLEEGLSKAHFQVPQHLQFNRSVSSADGHPSLISRQVQLEFLYHQGMCLLHRKFFVQGRLGSHFAHSRDRCVESALALLSLQDMLHGEAKARDSAPISHWFRIPLASHDFILAAMILCLELHKKREESRQPKTDLSIWDAYQKTILQRLETSCHIWQQIQLRSLQAWQVHQVLSSMLETLGVGAKVGYPKPNEMQALSPSDSEQVLDGVKDAAPSTGETFLPEADIDWVSQHTQ